MTKRKPKGKSIKKIISSQSGSPVLGIKINLLCLLIFTLPGFVSLSYSQTEELNFSLKNATLQNAIDEIENQSELSFFYNHELINQTQKRINIDIDDETLPQVLEKLFVSNNVSYELNGKRIILASSEPDVASHTNTDKSQPLKTQQQLIEVTGKVTDAGTGEPLPGVSIMVQGTYEGTISDRNGEYSIEMSPDGILVFSFIGYQEQNVPVEGQEILNIQLEQATEELEEVVVVGFGTQAKESVVGSITQISGENVVESESGMSISSSLQGELSGVTITKTSGQPGEAMGNILIRGKSTWQNNQPLVIVDGIERDFENIDPRSIESISVLKDASATAVYGVKGGNGVIMITTKTGKEGEMNVSYSSDVTIKQPLTEWQYLPFHETMKLANQAKMNDRNFTDLFTEEEMENYRSGDPYLYPNVNWYDVVVKDFGLSHNHNLNFSGGTKFVKYFASFGYAHEGDYLDTKEQEYYDPSFSYDRYNYRSNLDFDVTPTTRVSLKLSGILGIKNRPPYQDNNQVRTFRKIYQAPSYIFPPQYEDGNYGENPNQRAKDNPLVFLNKEGSRTQKTVNQSADLGFDQKLDFITEGLTVSGKVSYNSSFAYMKGLNQQIKTYHYSETDTTVLPDADFVEKTPTVSNENLSGGYVRSLYYESALEYERSISGDHNLSLLALFFRRETSNSMAIKRYEEHWVGRATYNYQRKYLFEFNGAYTGSEKFREGLRFGFFPSLAAGWVISNESFIEDNLPWLNKLKIRYSYGEVGNDQGAPRWTYITQFESAGNIQFGYPISGYPLYTEGGAPNRNATWETAYKQNLGIETRLFKGFTFDIDLFKERREGILMTRQTIPKWFGQTNPTANIGETKSQGYEVVIGYRGSITRDFTYRIGGYLNYSENRVVFRDDPADRLEYQKNAGKPIGHDFNLIVEDLHDSWDDVYNSTGSNWLPESRIPGDINYLDYNADGIIDDKDFTSYGDLNYPAYNYKLDLSLTYKNLSLSAMFYGVFNVSASLNNYMIWPFLAKEQIAAHPRSLNAWTPENKDTDIPALHWSDNDHNVNNNTYNYVNTEYLRFKRLQLTYTIQAESLKRSLGVESLTLKARGENLFTWTQFEDDRLDPESNRIDYYPQSRFYQMSIQVNF